MDMHPKFRVAIHAACAAAIVCCHASLAYAIRYELIDGAAGNQNGHTLSGFIEFDSPCGGDCTAANITDFTFMVSGPTNYSYSYQTPADVILLQTPGEPYINAGPKYLTIDFTKIGRLGLFDASDSRPLIAWVTAIEPGLPLPPPSIEAFYTSIAPNNSRIWDAVANFDQPVAIGVLVPEPATFAPIPAVCIAVGYFWRRNIS